MKNKFLIVIGTRPELIKLAPVIIEFKKRFSNPPIIILNTAQHKELLKPYWEIFQIKPDYELNFMKKGQSLTQLTARGLTQLEKFINTIQLEKTNIIGILAQGDTTTVMVSSMIAFYKNIPFFHLEAGLRTFDLHNPFPEEFNRKVASISAQIHFAPTKISKNNLKNEGIDKNIIVSGNTIVDAVNLFKSKFKNYQIKNKQLYELSFANHNHNVLITCHRRENHGKNLLNIISAVCKLANEFKQYNFIWPLHPNPNVGAVIKNQINPTRFQNIYLTEPLDYLDLLFVLSKSNLVLTDSGGIQEEAPSFNVPVLVLRKKTERPEGIESGVAWLVGTNKSTIYNKASELLKNKKFNFKNPYGNGRAAKIVVDNLLIQWNK